MFPFLEKEINSKTIEHIATSASILAEEENFLEQLAQEELKKILMTKKKIRLFYIKNYCYVKLAL